MLLEVRAGGGQRGLSFTGGLRIIGAVFFCHLQKEARLVQAAAKAIVTFDLAFELVLFFQDTLGGLGPIPKFLFAGLF
jgi:hypothetical protein